MACLKIEIELTPAHELKAELKMDTAGDELILEQLNLAAISPDEKSQRLVINLRTGPNSGWFRSWISSTLKKHLKKGNEPNTKETH